ncbi:MAG: hypothetical protein ABI425_02550 [Patescibacteria group bacterium]
MSFKQIYQFCCISNLSTKSTLSFLLATALASFILLRPAHTQATTITQDPQFVVVNFSDTFYFADWGAEEASWEAKVKPDLLKDILEMKKTLGVGTDNRKLAWSTLLEYTDFPMDTPSDSSRYVIQAKRIMELAEAADLPVYLPLNGFQWWNAVPELWNYWDPDGDHTPGCENDNYTKIVGHAGSDPIYSCKFPKLRDPEYRKQFIEGYNPNNKWNVEWQNWNTPMHLNWRNWGGGGVQLAPPPNLIDNPRVEASYNDFQTARFEAITAVISNQYKKWLDENKGYLFAGVSIGTEVSLNASVTKQDEFIPYGYRAIQDLICPEEQPTCGKEKELTQTEIHQLREQVVNQYLTNLSYRAVKAGLPKQRIYTHVWSEAKSDEPRYENYFLASINYYARPTLSLYGYAQDPLTLPLLATTLKNEGEPSWGASEFSTDKDAPSWKKAMHNTLDNTTNSAQLIDIYNWKEHKDTPAVSEIKSALSEKTDRAKPISEIIPLQEMVSINPTKIEWHLVPEQDEAEDERVVIFNTRQNVLNLDEKSDQTISLKTDDRSWDTSTLQPGFYQWFVERSRKQNDRTYLTRSVPQRIYIARPLAEDTTPWWVKQILKIEIYFEKKK